MLIQKVASYLEETLGLDATLSAWTGTGTLPYFLQDTYDFHVLELLGQHFLLMAMTKPRAAALTEIRRHMDKAATATGLQVIFATDALTSYERKRLIEHKAPFIVPGNQLYLHELGIDLRERFREPHRADDKPLSPSAQAILIAALLRPWREQLRPNELAAPLGYTAMTASRALKEISGTGVAKVREMGRERWLEFNLAPAELWDRLEPQLRSPIKRTIWTPPLPSLANNARQAGLSALASLSMIADPKYPVYAVSQDQWKAVQQLGIESSPEPEPGNCEWQVWRYSPALLPDRPTVDPLSLLLSFKGSGDERIESTLESLRKQLSW